VIRFASALAALIAIHSINVRAAIVDDVAARACAAIKSRVDAVAGDAPVFLRSYDAAIGVAAPDQPALRTAAFVYDNSLAVDALLACGDKTEALRVGEALRRAIESDMRLRNVYRAGEVKDKPLPNGWWDAKTSQWVEDRYQLGTATGNVAWAGLAMLALFDAAHDAHWRDAAAKLGQWIVDNTLDKRGVGGFNGGIDGFDAAPTKILWKSTEHNVDLIALFDRLDRLKALGDWKSAEASALKFVDSQWDTKSGHFFIGTQVDGVTPNRDSSGLDAQLWPQLLPNATRDWRRALNYVEREHGVSGGFDFNTDRDGAWIEGTAQAALVYRVTSRDADASRLFATIDAQFSTSGMVYATRESKITTGLATGASGESADFYYYRMPHLAATAWAVLAAKSRNPFVNSASALPAKP
jgi:hypothetical protein